MRQSPKKNASTKRPKQRLFRFLVKSRKKSRAPIREKIALKPSDLRKRKLVKRRNTLLVKLVLVFVAVVSMILLIWFGIHAKGLTIQKIDVRNEEGLSSEEIGAFIFETIGDDARGFFPRTNTFFVSIAALERSLAEKFIRIKRADILRKGFDELIVVIEERSPMLIFCEDIPVPKAGHYSGDCFFADSDGVVYSTAPYIPRSQFEIIYFSERVSDDILAKTPLTAREITALNTFTETLENKGIEVEEVHLVDSETIEVTTNKTYSLLVVLKEDYTDELERFFSALEAEVFDGERSIEDVYQFDLRYGRKVFYKYYE